MRRNFNELAAPIEASPERSARAAVERTKLDAEAAAYQRTLPQLRKARQMTQQALAAELKTTQGEVSKIERRTDLHLSTLVEYIEALGGRLELVAIFGEDRVPLSIGDLTSDEGDPDETAGDLAAG